MNTPLHSHPRRIQRAFTLIELIGVLAIIAIMAAVLAPATMRTIARTARDAERTSLRSMGEQVKFFLRTEGDLPGVGKPVPPAGQPPAWCADLAASVGLSAHDVWKTSRGTARSFLIEAGATPQRAMILSSLRTDNAALLLPVSGTMATNLFDLIWNTPDGSVPPAASFAGWAAWSTASAGEDLIISRISLQGVREEMKTFTIILNNTSGGTITGTTTTDDSSPGGGNGKGNQGNGKGNGGSSGGGTTTGTVETSWPAVTVRYAVIPVGGGSGPSDDIDAGQSVVLSGRAKGDRVDLNDGSNAVIFSYVVVDHDQSLAFDGARWRAE